MADSAADAVLGLVLAGGQSSRMGGYPKGLLPWLNDDLLIDVVLDQLRGQCSSLCINVACDAPPYAFRADRLLDSPTWQGAGPLAGVEAGLRWLNGHPSICLPQNFDPQASDDPSAALSPSAQPLAVPQWSLLEHACKPRPEWLAICPCDMPIQPASWVRRLIDQCQKRSLPLAWVVDAQGRDHPTLAVIHRSLWPGLQQQLQAGERRVLVGWRALGGEGLMFAHPTSGLPNLNTPEALTAARQAHQSATGAGAGAA